MPDSTERDLAAFQEQVDRALELLLDRESSSSTVALAYGTERGDRDSLEAKAERYLATPTLKQRICAALTGAGNDIFDVAKFLTPVVYTTSIAGVVAIPLNPVLYAWMALLIARMGINAYCTDPSS